jgi:hypothetical protein
MLKAMERGIHEHAARGSHVGCTRRERTLGDLEREGWMSLLILPDSLCGGVGAVVQQNDDFVEVVTKGASSLVDLMAQGIEGCRQCVLFVSGWNDDDGSAGGLGGRVEERRVEVVHGSDGGANGECSDARFVCDAGRLIEAPALSPKP